VTLEEKLAGWTGPSSTTEQDKQARTERMVKDAIAAWPALSSAKVSLSVYAKGSYPNNTNVRTDSDVDIAVQCHDVRYWGEHTSGAHPPISPYSGLWTPQVLRLEIEKALRSYFGKDQVDTTGSTAITVRSSSARVDADVVPCFDYRYYLSADSYRDGTQIFKKSGAFTENYPVQHLAKGREKNNGTSTRFKNTARIMKRVANTMAAAGTHRAVPSFFVESLVYNCPDALFLKDTWTERVRGVILHIWSNTQGNVEPASGRLVEVNGCRYLFSASQPWTRADGRDFAKAAWNYFGYK
jgi:hypothetical protein